jgi:hypothetical protein
MAIKTTKFGRVIRTGRDYGDLRRQVWQQQNELCADCRRYSPFASSELHHLSGRGMHGSKRDDCLDKVKMLCWDCHSKYEAGIRVRQ